LTTISVVVASYSPGPRLHEIAHALTQQAGPPPALEIVLVVTKPSSPFLTPLQALVQTGTCRIVPDPGIGLSYARNLGIINSSGDIICFLDDTAVPEEGYLETVKEVFADPKVDAMGGPVIPAYEGSLPAWFGPAFHEFIGSYISVPAGEMSYSAGAYGANMAFRRIVFQRFGLFDCRLGRKPGSLLSGEESEFFLRIHRGGARSVFKPCARVRHHVPADRLSKRFARQRFFWGGVTDVRVKMIIGLPRPRIRDKIRALVAPKKTQAEGPSIGLGDGSEYETFLKECSQLYGLGRLTEMVNPYGLRHDRRCHSLGGLCRQARPV